MSPLKELIVRVPETDGHDLAALESAINTALQQGNVRVEVRLVKTEDTAKQPSAPGPNVETAFRHHAQVWRKETAHLSRADWMAEHPSYRAIIGLGRPVVPLILKRLKRAPEHWFAALREITGANPVSPEEAGDVRKMAAAWVAWGQSEGLIP